MPTSSPDHALLQLLHPLSPPNKHRTVPLQILALGISRSGTDSLRQALLDLGYNDVYHGFKFGESPNDPVHWIRLAQAQQNGDKSLLVKEEFDRMTGDCAAITDIPAAGFAHELLDCYPDAKVILNYREDVDAWAASCEKTVEVVIRDRSRGWEYLQTLFQRNLFWQRQSYWWVWSRYVDGDFSRNGKEWYRNHYRKLEERLQAEGRSYLKWKVEDGWVPLCEFLGKEIPGGGREFPNGNVPKDFIERSLGLRAKWVAEARSNMAIVVAGVVAVVGVAGYYLASGSFW